jgi:ribosomal protein S18 acetylase RimI-like enzyme
MEKRLVIGEATPEDLPVFVDYIVRMLKLNAEFDPLLKVDADAEREVLELITKNVGDPKFLLLVARLDNRPAGVLRAEILSRRFYSPKVVGQIDEIYVMPEFRRKEVGSMLLSKADEELRRRGAEMIVVEFPTQNYIASSFYGKEGFRPLKGVQARETDMR